MLAWVVPDRTEHVLLRATRHVDLRYMYFAEQEATSVYHAFSSGLLYLLYVPNHSNQS